MLLYGLGPDAVVTDEAGNVDPGRALQIFTALTGGSLFGAAYAFEGTMTPGAALGGTVTADDRGRVAFFADGTSDTLYLEFADGSDRWPVNPTSISSVVQTKVDDALPALEAVAQGAADTAEAALAKVENVPSVNVRDFGAVGDGTTNDRAAFVAAAGTGKAVYVPAGTYRIDGTIPAGWFFGQGVVEAGAYSDEILPLDQSVPTRMDTVMVGDGHRNDLAVGQDAMANAGTESGANVAIGTNALRNPARSQRNTAIGSGAAKILGNYDEPGVSTTNGNARRNVWVGTDAGWASVWADRNTYVGSNAGKWAGDPDPIAHQHDFFEGNPAYSLAGIDAADRWPTARADLVGAPDAPAQVAVNELDNCDNVGVGRNTLLHAVKSSQCVAAGTNALAHGFLVRSSTAIGDGALRDGLKASFNTAVGSSALLQMASGQFNVALGNNAMRLATHTDGHVAIGYGALENFTGGVVAPTTTTNRRNIAIGYGAANTRVSGTEGIAIGPYANITNYNNAIAIGPAAEAVTNATALGHTAKANGASSVALGINATSTHTSSVAIGPNAATTANNQIQLGAAGSNVVAAGPVASGGWIRSAQYTTAGRPSASTAGAGSMIYDTTLGKPIWSSGSVWRDAAGTVV